MNSIAGVDISQPASGSILPSFGFAGARFLHTPVGRKIEYEYDGSNWNSIHSFGTVTIYTDPAGTDSLNHGFGPGANAFQTIEYAWDMLPATLGANATIYPAAGTYAANLNLNGKWVGNKASITIDASAALSTIASLTATGAGAIGSGATRAAFTQTGIVAHAYQYKLLHFTSGANNGLYRIIHDNSTSSLDLAGLALNAQPVLGDTAQVLDFGVVISGSVIIGYEQINLWITGIKFTNSNVNDLYSWVQYTNCYLTTATNVDISKSVFLNCYVGTAGVALCNSIFTGCDIGNGQGYGVVCNGVGTAVFTGGNVIHDTSVAGVYCDNASVSFVPGSVNDFIINGGTYWIAATTGGRVTGNSNVNKSGTGANYADAATYSFIQN